ncbi:hypothetical protein EST38_g13548 [Candolleomyces aberdarensis]|uniref:Uncharacterized protein n=1 Tax=Candolleomyces aberdarensis TaxID=2316362 RepID=A0A4V1Q1P5_9AGAR|nr:hypothetical protein EST38_g13548 [Candolleomyces aberdarensis]
MKLVEERDYHGLIKALKDTYPAVLQIAKGERLHPITEVANAWTKKLPASTKGHLRSFHVAEFRDQFLLPIYPAHRTIADQYTSDVHQELQRHSKSDEISISYVSILFELVVLRQYLTLDPSHDAEIYELSRILGDDDYNWSSTDDFALRGRIQRHFTIHEKAFQSTVNNVAGKLQPVAGSSTENASSWLTELHLNEQLDRAGVVKLENPLDLIRVLQEDGSSYIFGTVNHKFKDDMSLTRSINPTSTQQEELSFTPHSPQPFPLAQLPIDDNPNFANPTKSSITTSDPAKPPPQPFRVIQPAPANHMRTQSKPLRQTQLSFPVALKPTSDVIDPASQAPKRQLRQVTMNQWKAADPDSRPMKRRKKV